MGNFVIKPSSETQSVPAVSVKELNLVNFRNYSQASLRVESGSVVITGSNGSGKTNILEAVSLLAPGRGIRNAPLDAFVSQKPRDKDSPFAATPWSINSTLRSVGGEVVIGTGRQDGGKRERRIVKIDGEQQRGQAGLSEYVSVCYLTPRMDSLFVEGSTSRRQYLDRLTSNLFVDHTKYLAIYEQAKSERLRLLKSGHADPQWLEVLERRMAEKGVAIAVARLEAINLLQGAIKEDVSPFPKAGLSVAGEAENLLKEGLSAVQVEEKLAGIFESVRNIDRQASRTTQGIHKSDFVVTHIDNGFVAEYCSTGEQKALLLGITMASVRAKALWAGMVPLLLLDEVVAHLDDGKRQALIEAIEGVGAQCWMTGTDVSFFAKFQGKAQFFIVEDSNISG